MATYTLTLLTCLLGLHFSSLYMIRSVKAGLVKVVKSRSVMF